MFWGKSPCIGGRLALFGEVQGVANIFTEEGVSIRASGICCYK